MTMTIEVPFDIGDILDVDTTITPTGDMDFGDEKVPKFLKGRVISIRKSKNGLFVKLGLKAPWVCNAFYEDTGYEEYVCEKEKPVSIRVSAFGHTVFPTEKA